MSRVLAVLLMTMLIAACQPVMPVPASETAVGIHPDPVATVIAAGSPAILTPLTSPDGQWKAQVTAYDCTSTDDGEMAYERLTLIEVATSKETTAAAQTIACGGLGAYGLDGLFWSANSRYFYFTAARTGVPDGCGYWEQPVSRLDIETLTVTELGGGVRSPDGSKLAAWQDKDTVVWDVESGEATRIPAARPSLQIGPMAWSPDSRSLVYLQVAAYCPPSGDSVLVRLDLPATDPDIMLEAKTPTFGGVAWEAPDSLSLTDAAGDRWHFNLATQELTRTS